MKKSKVILAVTIILALAVTGCGTNNSNAEKSQKETVAKVTDDKKADSQNKASLKTTEKSEEAELKTEETIVKEDKKAAAQQTALTENSTSDTNSSSSGNTTGNSNSSTTSGNHNNSGNTASSSGNGGSSNSGSGNNANSSNGNNGSSGNNNTFDNNTNQGPTPQHEHTWTHVDATGHYETVTIQAAWDEVVPVYDDVEHSICNTCGADITGHSVEHLENNLDCGGYHSEWRYEQTGTQTIHHDAVTEQRWVQDTPAYDVCSGCGATR